jgi:hypothetical protein
VDRDAAIHFIKASVATPAVTKFLMVSFIGSRLRKPSWWDEENWKISTTRGALQRYYEAKVAADQVLYEEARKRDDFAGICLRPGTLTEQPAGKVELGQVTRAKGNVSRASVAQVSALLLESDAKSVWLDLLDGEQDAAEAVAACVKEGVNTAEGEPFF